MQNKGAITFFAILLAAVCVFHLSFTFVSSRVKNNAKEYAKEYVAKNNIDKTTQNVDSISFSKENFFLDSISGEKVYNFLGLRKYSYRECQQREINLGLDLKGGMNVVLEVSLADIMQSLAVNQDSVFKAAVKIAIEEQKNSQTDFVTLFGEAFKKVSPGGSIAQYYYANPAFKNRIDYNTSNKDVLDIIRTEANDAVDNTFNVIRNRIDKFGVSQPNIQRLESSGRIMVELPGVKSPDRVRNILQSTAQLEFWETHVNDQQFYNYLVEANNIIRDLNTISNGELIDSSKATTTEVKTEVSTDTTKKDELSLVDELATQPKDSASVGQDQAKDYPLFSVLMPNINPQNNTLIKSSVIGIAHSKDIKKVDAYLSLPQVKSAFPRDVKFLWSAKARDEAGVYFELHAIKIPARGKAPLEGDAVTDARLDYGQHQATAQVSMSMNAEGAKTWARLTRENIDNFIAIVLDERVYSAPVVNQEIKGGNSSISGNFTVEEAKDLANILKSGKLPAPARIVQEAIVGPSLGQDAINSGFLSFVLAFIMVLIFMLIYYSRRAGAVANIALIVNVFFIIGVLAAFGAVLTLPGIAGIVLTLGMAVDANVLIYERIREEITAGKGIKLAVKDGFNNAYSAIIDGNVTTLLTGVILFVFGSGPIKGFATTLIIGILTSLFCGIFITRLIFEVILKKEGKLTFSTKFTENAFKNLNVKFLESRKTFYIISSVIVISGIISLVFKGLNQGVDFTGGRTYVVRFDKTVSNTEVQGLLKGAFEGNAPSVITYGRDNQLRIITKYKIDEQGTEVDDIVETKLYEGLKPVLGNNVTKEMFLTDYRKSSEKVGPSIADDLKAEAVLAIIFSIIVIFLYILIRFKKWQYGLGAIASLAHDALVVVGLYSILDGFMPFSLEIDQGFIAAILTVIGYSINDTVIIFDRIRENVLLHPKRDKLEIYNKSLNETLSRTFSTTFTTIIVLVMIFIFGGEVIRGFVFALMIGIIVGTYSSLFVATPIAFDAINREKEKK